HIDIASREFQDYKLEAFRLAQMARKEEVQRCLSQTRISFNSQQSLSSSSQVADCSPGSIQRSSMSPQPGANQRQYEMLRKTASLYTDMVEVIASLVERERKLCESEHA